MDLSNRFTGPIDAAHGLPADAYRSAEFLRHEQASLFLRHWHAVGFEHDVADAGDVFPVLCASGVSLILVRDQAGAVRVFHNFCRHRGMRLVAEPQQGRRTLVCPYHAWCYGLDGTLQRIPHRDGFGAHGAPPAHVPGLVPVRSHVWAGIVFVDRSGEAAPFEAYIEPLSSRWRDYDFSLLRHGASMHFDVPGNWKLAIENFIDIYHVPYVHPGLNQYNNMADHYFIQEGPVLGEGNAEYRPADEGAGKLPMFPGLSQTQQQTIEAVCLFPNLLLTVFSDNLRVILVEPTGPGSCRERVSIFFVGDEALEPCLEDYRRAVVARFPSFNDEDVGVVTRLQEAFENSAYDRAHFLPFFDGNVHRFQQLVGRACAADGADACFPWVEQDQR